MTNMNKHKPCLKQYKAPHLGNGMVTVSQPNLITMSSSVHTIDKKSQDCRPNFVKSLKNSFNCNLVQKEVTVVHVYYFNIT